MLLWLTGDSFTDLHFNTGMGISTISDIVLETCEAVTCMLKEEYMKVKLVTCYFTSYVTQKLLHASTVLAIQAMQQNRTAITTAVTAVYYLE